MIQNLLNYLKKLIPIDLDSMVLESSENGRMEAPHTGFSRAPSMARDGY